MRRIAALWLACASALALAWVGAAPPPAAPERDRGLGAEEAGVVRRSPHGTGDGFTPATEPDGPASAECLTCHASAAGALTGPMATRADERAFAHRAFGPVDGERFFEQSCAGCHVANCSDCHGAATHPVGRPPDETCLRCHRDGSVGAAYHGRAPREDHPRYHGRPAPGVNPVAGPLGATSPTELLRPQTPARTAPIASAWPAGDDAARYLHMLPDVHQEKGLLCADCHRMGAHGHDAAKGTLSCRDCHPAPDPDVPEHAITAHLEKLRCSACHAAWAAQEYGTFLVKPQTAEQQEAFSVLPQLGEWRKSAVHKRQDAPPLGLDADGLVTPIRPKLVLFATDPARRWENRMLAAEWVPFEPHTVRRGSVTCSGCHDQPRRFVLEADADRILRPDLDGLALRSFWNRDGQTVRGGAFLPGPRHAAMNRKTDLYVRESLKQWQNLLRRVGPPSAR